LNDDDLGTMKCGYIALLPKNREGRNVLCCDASRLPKDDVESRLRCLFYMLHVATDNAARNTDVSLMLIVNKLSFERMKGDKYLADILKAFPAKIAAIHLIRQPARLGINFFEEKVIPKLKSLFQILNIPIYVHSGTQTYDLRQDLASHGFDINNLPRSLGGGWTYEDFLEWRNQQLILEGTTQIEISSGATTRNLPQLMSQFQMSSEARTGNLPKPTVATTSSFAPSISTISQNALLPTTRLIDDFVTLPLYLHSDRSGLDLGLDQQQLLQRRIDLQQLLQFNHIYDQQNLFNTGQQLDLPQLLRHHSSLDQQQLFPNFQRIPLATDCDNLVDDKPPAEASLVALLNSVHNVHKSVE
jgi:Divergent CRAL/TRIO domain